jgi:chromosome partitioning protein
LDTLKEKAMATVVSIINLKGGVGKSTLAMMFSEYLAFRFNKRVLLIDMDAQANLSYLMVPYRSMELQKGNHRTIYDFFKLALSGKASSLGNFVARPPLIVSNIARNFDVARNRSK